MEKGSCLIEMTPIEIFVTKRLTLLPSTTLLGSEAPWLYMGSFSKVLWPGLRTWFMWFPAAEFSPHFSSDQARLIDLHTNRSGQKIYSGVVASEMFPAHIV